jgi:hypothetical protein
LPRLEPEIDCGRFFDALEVVVGIRENDLYFQLIGKSNLRIRGLIVRKVRICRNLEASVKVEAGPCHIANPGLGTPFSLALGPELCPSSATGFRPRPSLHSGTCSSSISMEFSVAAPPSPSTSCCVPPVPRVPLGAEICCRDDPGHDFRDPPARRR